MAKEGIYAINENNSGELAKCLQRLSEQSSALSPLSQFLNLAHYAFVKHKEEAYKAICGSLWAFLKREIPSSHSGDNYRYTLKTFIQGGHLELLEQFLLIESDNYDKNYWRMVYNCTLPEVFHFPKDIPQDKIKNILVLLVAYYDCDILTFYQKLLRDNKVSTWLQTSLKKNETFKQYVDVKFLDKTFVKFYELLATPLLLASLNHNKQLNKDIKVLKEVVSKGKKISDYVETLGVRHYLNTTNGALFLNEMPPPLQQIIADYISADLILGQKSPVLYISPLLEEKGGHYKESGFEKLTTSYFKWSHRITIGAATFCSAILLSALGFSFTVSFFTSTALITGINMFKEDALIQFQGFIEKALIKLVFSISSDDLRSCINL